MSNALKSVSTTKYGAVGDIEASSIPEAKTAASSALVGPIPTGSVVAASATKDGRDGKNIWDEYYPLVQPAHQYHHRNDRNSSNYFFHGMFSADVMWAYRDAVIAYLVALYSMVVLSLTGLVFCKQWGIGPDTPIVFAFRCLWFISPAVASLALRNSTLADDRAKIGVVMMLARMEHSLMHGCCSRWCSCEVEIAGLQYATTLEHPAVVPPVQELSLVEIDAPTCAVELRGSSAV